MYASKIILSLGAILATAFAAPAPAAAEGTLTTTDVAWEDTLETDYVTLGKSDNVAVVTTYSGDTCNGNNSQFTLVGGGDRCVPFTNVRSISVSGSGCSIHTWSGNNCRGSNAGIAYGRCTSVLYASVSVKC